MTEDRELSPREMLAQAKTKAVMLAHEAADKRSWPEQVIVHPLPTEEHPYGSACPVHETVHNSHGWCWCEPDPDFEAPTWAEAFLRELQRLGFAVHESIEGPPGATGPMGLPGRSGGGPIA